MPFSTSVSTKARGSSRGSHQGGVGSSASSYGSSSCSQYGIATVDSPGGGGKELVRLQLQYSKAQASLREKDEQISKMTLRLKAMEESAAKLKVSTLPWL